MVPIAPRTDDAETTHQQALTAANLAFERANERGVAKKAPTGQDSTSITNNGVEPKLGRKQSVRFTGPTAMPLRNRSITRREAPGHRTNHHPYESQLQAQSHKNEISISSNERELAALAQPVGEFGESDSASVPSSYRRLRKAKSMFSPGKTPSAVFSDGISKSRRHFHSQSLQSSDTYHEQLRTPDPRLRKSYSFLRGVTDRISTSSRQYATNDAAVQLARDQYLRQLEQQRLKKQPSFLGLGNRRKPHRAFRKTVRTSSTNSYGSATASPLASVEPPKIKEFGHRARSLSQTIKNKIKQAFKRCSDTNDTIPVQQIKATYPHYGDYILTSDGKEQRYPPVPELDAELLLRVGSRESVGYTAPVFVDKNSPPGSIRSAHSDDNESNGKSRVTSWTDSTAANTINMSQPMARKRLSIIKEDGGPHQSSSSARNYEVPSDGYAGFRQPVRQNSAGHISGSIDTQRIVSALQKKIDENNRKAALDDSESGTDSSSGHQKRPWSTRTPRKTSSVRKGAKAKFRARRYQEQDFSDLRKDLTMQQIAQMNEHGILLPKRPLREVKSAFFPPSVRIERSNQSPYRRAMHASGETEADPQNRVIFDARPRPDDPSRAATGQLRHGSITGSDSIYSRSSGGDTPKLNRSSISLAMSESSGEAGTALVVRSLPGKKELSAHPAVTQHEHSSVASSGDWRDFMTTQVASLENYGTRQGQTDDAHPVKDSGHRRENAQVTSDEFNIGTLQWPNEVLKQPLAIIQANSNHQKSSKHKTSHSLEDRSPLMSIGPSTNVGNVKRNENAPLSRAEHSRKISNMDNDRGAPIYSHEPSGGLRQQNSNSSLRTHTEQKTSPTTAKVRHSPERAERLRRLKSSSGTSLGKPLGQNENQEPRHTPSNQKAHDPDGADKISNVPQIQAGMNHKLVDSFLQGRRSVMRISEESGTDHAFL